MPATLASPAPQPPYPVYKFSVADYHRMIQSGIFDEDHAVELLEGWIVPKMPHNPRHDNSIDRLQDRLRPIVPPTYRLRIQSAITLADSEPEPDLVLARGTLQTFEFRHPGPGDIGLTIEVSDSTLATDRKDKGRIYAAAGLREYWVVNLVDRRIEVYTQPGTDAQGDACFLQRRDYGVNDQVSVVLDGQHAGMIAVQDVLRLNTDAISLALPPKLP